MKASLLQHLVCVNCKSPELELDVAEVDGAEIMEGYLFCACGHRYPILRGVPRMLDLQKLSQVQRATQEAFGYEWNRAHDYHADNFSDWLPTGYEPEPLFSGKVGLEVGCGAGRHAYTTSLLAREHIAVDLSDAVDAAFPRLRERPNCHVVQADAFNLPFRDQSFDYVYCLGVLQHMHDPEKGFAQLARHPKRGGMLLVNVYQASRPVMIALLAAVRTVTTSLPNRVIWAISVLAGVVDYAVISTWKLISRTPLRVVGPIVPGRIKEYAKHDFHTVITDWFDRLACPVKKHYTDAQLADMYSQNGYHQVSVTPYWKAFWNGYGVRNGAV